MMGVLQEILHLIVEFAILIFEYIGVGVILCAGIRGILNYIRRNPSTRLDLAKGLAMGLEFKLGSEILRTVEVREICRRNHCSSCGTHHFDPLGN